MQKVNGGILSEDEPVKEEKGWEGEGGAKDDPMS